MFSSLENYQIMGKRKICFQGVKTFLGQSSEHCEILRSRQFYLISSRCEHLEIKFVYIRWIFFYWLYSSVTVCLTSCGCEYWELGLHYSWKYVFSKGWECTSISRIYQFRGTFWTHAWQGIIFPDMSRKCHREFDRTSKRDQ